MFRLDGFPDLPAPRSGPAGAPDDFLLAMGKADRKAACAEEFGDLKAELERGEAQIKAYRKRMREAHDHFITNDKGPSGDLSDWPDRERYLNESALLLGNMRNLASGLLGKILELEMKCPGDNLTPEQRRTLGEHKGKLNGVLQLVAQAAASARSAASETDPKERKEDLERSFNALGRAAEQFGNVVTVGLAFVLGALGIRIPGWNP